MRKIATIRFFALVFACVIGSAQANQAEMAAHARAMNDIAATPPCCNGGDDDDNDGWEGYEPNFSAAELQEMLDRSRREEADSLRRHQERMARDPEYRSFFDGFWNFRPAQDNAPGQYCAARFYREGSSMIVLGPGGDSPYAYLALYGRGVPVPKSPRKLTVRLHQTGEAPQTVEVFNLAMAGTGGDGMLLMAVPNADALLDGMLDQHRFEVFDSKQREVFYILEWTGGLAARDKLRACIGTKS
ncbi:hypothetical protein [Lysobacter sp. Root983]|uniref:hypothetical protein n=1 Tax=Lysobacter sp. Root983 TaxID=1736613 RepID=UPI0012FA1B01|nr:hypothetical protein [Lysobacter sp. Root983]